MRKMMMMSQLALTMYIFQPMFARPIGMMKTKTMLLRYQLRFMLHSTANSRKSVEHELAQRHSIGTNRVVQDLWRIEEQ